MEKILQMNKGRKSRPLICPCKETCTPIWNGLAFDTRIITGDLNEGYSGDCIGKSQLLTYTVGGNEHVNDMNQCIFTPLKGIIRMMINLGDIEAMYMMSQSVLSELNPIPCDGCGVDARKFRLKDFNGKKFCINCELERK